MYQLTGARTAMDLTVSHREATQHETYEDAAAALLAEDAEAVEQMYGHDETLWYSPGTGFTYKIALIS